MATEKTFSNVYLSADYTDLEIRCSDLTFHAHRAAVCARSKVLEVECKTGFPAGGKIVVEHSTFKGPILDCALQFVYQNAYTVPAADEDASAIDEYVLLTAHVFVHAFADMYEIEDLKTLAAQNFITAADQATDLSAAQLIELIASIYTQTTGREDALRVKVLEIVLTDKRNLSQNVEFVGALTLRKELQEFATLFIGEMAVRYEDSIVDQQKSHGEVLDRVESALEKAEKARDKHQGDARRAKEAISRLEGEARAMETERARLMDDLSRLQIESQTHANAADSRAAELTASRATASAAQKELIAVKPELLAAKALAEDRRAQLNRAFSPDMTTRRLAFWQTFERCRHTQCAKHPFDYFERYEGGSWVAQCKYCSTRHFYTGV